MRAKSSKQRCPALCINDSSCLRLQGWWLIWPPLAESGSRSDFQGVYLEGRQARSVLIFVVTQKRALWLSLIQRSSDFSLVL